MKRAYRPLLFEYLNYFPCVGIVGPRQCGKTTFINELPENWKRIDLEKQSDYQSVARDPDLFLRLNPAHVALDEAQILPSLFPALRVAIDQRRAEKGRFVITGSSSPQLVRAISESLAGRIGLIEIAPFTSGEACAKPVSPLFSCLIDKRPLKEWDALIKPRISLERVHDYWLRGGYPEPWLKDEPRFQKVWVEQYVQTYLERDLARLFPGLNQNRFRLFIQLLAGLSGTIINYSDVARSLGVSPPTVRDYFEIAHGSFLWRSVPAYEKKALKRIVKHPKGYMRDTGLLHHLLRVGDFEALSGHPQMGRSWEGLVVEQLLRGLHMRGIEFDYFHYRTGAGAEVDLVLEGDFGLVPVEIKYTQTVPERHLRAITDFINENKCPFGIVINNDEGVRFYNEKLIGVPFACL